MQNEIKITTYTEVQHRVMKLHLYVSDEELTSSSVIIKKS